MVFLSNTSRHRVVIEPSDLEYIPVQGGVNIPQTKKGVTVEFEPLSSPREWPEGVLPLKDGVLRGFFSTNNPDIIEALVSHRGYMVDYIGIDDDGTQVAPDDWVIQKLDDGTVRCRVCNKFFENPQGASGHERSEAHQEKLAERRKTGRDSLEKL